MSFQRTRNRLRLRTGSLILALTMALISPALAQPIDAASPLKANDLLRQAVANEAVANEAVANEAVANEKTRANRDYYAWMQRLQKPRGSVTKLMVETPQGVLSRTLAVNDKALTDEERRQDDMRASRLLDPEKMRDKFKSQHEDRQHVEHLLSALPDAFHCEYAAAAHEDRNLRLECSPDPHFSAPNYESQVFQGMKTVIHIDREEMRLTRLEGTLFKDVSFGWGFLARLNRGGRIEITQSRVAGKHWGVTRMQVAFNGRVLVVKPLHLEQTETSWDYHAVPRMTVAQALEFLRKSPANPSR